MADDKRMREALTLAQRALNAAPRFQVGDTDSDRIAAMVDKALAEPGPEAGQPLPSPGEDGPAFAQIRSILAERRQIAILWTVDDVQAVRPDLDEDQAWKVLQRVEQNHDGNYGVTFDTIESASWEQFPDPDPLTTAGARTLPPTAGMTEPPPSITAAILADPKAFLPESGHCNDNDLANGNGPDRGR